MLAHPVPIGVGTSYDSVMAVFLGDSTERDKLVAEWLDPEKWKTPSWFAADSEHDGVRDFERYFTHQLRTRYLELEGDFRSVVGNFPPQDVPTAEAIFGLLQGVRPALATKHPELLSITSTLDLVERYMVWLYPHHVLKARLTSTITRLVELRPSGWKSFLELLQSQVPDPNHLRAPLDEAIAACNRRALAQQIGNGLQIRRLKSYRIWGIVMLGLLSLLSPMLFNPAEQDAFPAQPNISLLTYELWPPALAVLLVGTLGGYLSGLLQARSSRATLADYEVGMLTLSLRPVVGGLAALLLFVLLSWHVFPAIDTRSAGSYLLAGLLAGFSERYFLRLLKVAIESNDKGARAGTEVSPPPPGADAP